MFRLLNYTLATGLGTGYSPVAPGTAGSILSLIVIYLLSPLNTLWFVVGLFLLFWIGVYSGSQVEAEKGEDPQIVVIDEIVGMGISLVYLPPDWRLFLVAFALFRFFDVRKPGFINRVQNLHGGLGIMLDDVIAGIYSLVGVQLIRFFLF